MVSLVSKRQQARNERALQDLINSIPGNDRCADCSANNPGWASWSLGIFLCMRCAACHRKLGTHVSKVKSLSMDSWNAEQVDTMKRVGNTTSNRTFNPKNVKPSIPIDADEVDSAMERFIRQKYEQRAFVTESQPARQREGSASSDDGHRPPLPPKPGRKFGFGLRSTSSASARTYGSKTIPPLSPSYTGSNTSSSSTKANKQARVMGLQIGNTEDDFDAKLAILRDMGFRDMRNCSTILRSMNSDLDRTVEALVRSGENGPAPSGPITPTSINGFTNGLIVEKGRQSNSDSNNLFHNLAQAQQPRSATMPIYSFSSSQQAGLYTPTLNTNSQNYSQPPSDTYLQASMSNLQISRTTTPLSASSSNTNPFLSQTFSQAQPQQSAQHPNSGLLANALTAGSMGTSNPFLRPAQSQNNLAVDSWNQPVPALQVSPVNPWISSPTPLVNTADGQPSTPYQPSPGAINSPGLVVQGSPLNATNPYTSLPTASTGLSTSNNAPIPYQLSTPYLNLPQLPQVGPTQTNIQSTAQQNQFQNVPHNTSPMMYGPPSQVMPNNSSTMPPRYDKLSILALYNQPSPTYMQTTTDIRSSPLTGEAVEVPPRSATMPPQTSTASGSLNPFGQAPSEQRFQGQQAASGAPQDAFSWLHQS